MNGSVWLLIAGSIFGTSKPAPYVMQATFNPSEVAWATKPGAGAIAGSALLRTQGGDVKSCAGLTVEAVPDSTYARERMMHIYGSIDEGFSSGSTPFVSTDPEYERSIIETACDAQGNFTFQHLPSGSYFITTVITWSAPQYNSIARLYVGSRQGGGLMRHVDLRDGEARHIVLTG